MFGRRTLIRGALAMPFGQARTQGFADSVLSNFAAGNVRINEFGEFIYAGTPAFGNLIYSNTNATGTDKYSNAYLAGVTSYGASLSGSGVIASNMNAGIATNWTAPSSSGPWSLQSQLPAVSSDSTAMTSITVTPSRITKIWPVFANDASAGTVYRLTCAGNGTWGNPQEQLNFPLEAFGTEFAMGEPIGAVAMGAGDGFSFWVTWEFQVVNFAAGTCNVSFRGILSTNDQSILQARSISFAAFVTGLGLNFASNSDIRGQASWQAAGSGSTITGNYSVFERLGQAPG